MEARIGNHIRSNVVGYVAVFLALTGTAGALPGQDTVDSGDIINAEVKRPDLAADAVTSGKIRDSAVKSTHMATGSVGAGAIQPGSVAGLHVDDNSLNGDDVNESQLGLVPAATLGGLGRSGNDADNSCDPEDATLIVCTSVDLTLPVPTRVLVIGQIAAQDEADAEGSIGTCELGTNVVDLPSTSTLIVTTPPEDPSDDPTPTENAALVGVTPPLGPGTVQFRIRCNQLPNGAIVYRNSEIAAVGLSPS